MKLGSKETERGAPLQGGGALSRLRLYSDDMFAASKVRMIHSTMLGR